MILGSRNKRSALEKLRQMVWPRAGWKRTVTYVKHRLVRLPGTPYSIAAGFACGAAISFTPFVGLHFILGGLMAWLIRANILASAIGTAIGNPWTFPFIWWWVYTLGAWIIGIQPADEISIELTVEGFSSETMILFLSMLIGGIVSGAVIWLAFYFPLYYLVEKYQQRRRARREAKARRRAASVPASTETGSPT